MIRPPIIGISGPARVGKSTAAELLLRMGVGKYVYSFADPLRAMIKAGFGIDLDNPYWALRKEDPMPEYGGHSPRSLLQLLGTEWGRHLVHQDVWLTLATRAHLQRGPGMIIADVRFENEATWIRSRGGIVMHLERGKAPKVRPHPSEAGVLQQACDWHVYNESTERSLALDLARRFEVGEFEE